MKLRFGLGLWLSLVLVLSLHAQSFSPAQTRLEVVSNPIASPLPVRIAVTTSGGFDLANLSASADVNWVSVEVIPAAGAVELTFATQGLVARTSAGTVTLSGGGQEANIAVEVITSLLDLVVLQADPVRPVVYGLQQDEEDTGGLLIYDPVAEAGIGFLTVGEKPTDMAISADAAEAIVLCSASQQIYVIDLVSRSVADVINLPSYSEWGIEDSAGSVFYGPGNLIYYSDGAWESNLHVLDRTTGGVLQTKAVGVGDAAMLPDGSAVVGWHQYGWTAGLSVSHAFSVPVNAQGLLGEVVNTSNNMSRDPQNTPAILTRDGSTVFLKQHAYAVDDLSVPIATFAGPIYAASANGEVVATSSGVFDTATGNELVSLPTESSVQAITADYTRLVLFDSQRELRVVELLDALWTVDLEGQEISPADRSAVTPPAALTWIGLPGVDQYQVYLGTSAAEVDAGTPEDAVFVGTATEGRLELGETLASNQTYYWRVDAVVGDEIIRGIQRSFLVSLVAPTVRRIDAATVQAHSDYVVVIDLEGESDGLAWSASSADDWVSFTATNGVTPGALEVHLDASQLAAGAHESAILLTHDDGEVSLPIYFTVDEMVVTHLRSDPATALSYAISEDSSQTVPRAYLLEIDSEAETILRAVRVGQSVTDFELHNLEGRIYVTNWGPGFIVAVDKATMRQVRSYGFAPGSSYTYGDGDPYRVAAGGAGRIIVEAEDQWVDMFLVDTLTGETLVERNVREGGGVSTAGGRYYYHGDSNSSGATLQRYDLLGDKFTQLASKRVDYVSYYGSRNVVGSDDGSRIFWNGAVFTASLEEEWALDAQVYSTNADGSLAFGRDMVFDVENKTVAYAMPTSTTVSTFNNTSGKLIVPQNGSLAFYDLSVGVPLVAPELSAVALSNTQVQLTWTDHSLETSLTLQTRQAGQDEWTVLQTLDGNVVTFTHSGLSAETSYDYRIRANTSSEASDWSNVASVTTPPAPPSRPSITELSRIADNNVLLRWNAYGEVDQVVVERRGPNESEFGVIATLDAPAEAQFTDTDPKMNDAYYYYRIQTIRAGQVSSYSWESYVNIPSLSAPSGGSLYESFYVNEGASNTWWVSIYGNPYPTIRWYHNGILLPEQTEARLELTNIDILQAGTYHYELSNSTGSFRSNDMVLTVNAAADPLTGSHNYLRHGFEAGGLMRIRSTFSYVGAVSSLGWQVLLPDGWSYVSTDPGAGADVSPQVGQTGYLEWAWFEAPPSGDSFTYTLAVPDDAAVAAEFAGLVLGTKNNSALQSLLRPDPLTAPEVPWHHSADTNRDGAIGLSELLRVIELYNTRYGSTRTGRYQTSEVTLDRYATAPETPADVAVNLPDFHSADSDHDASISLSELLRVIELYNTRSGTQRTGAYRAAVGTDDGFEPGGE